MADRRFLTIILVAALLLRFAFILTVAPLFMPDSWDNLGYSRSLLERGYYMSGEAGDLAGRTPGYPLLIAFFLWLFGDRFAVALCLTQAAVEVLMIPLLYEVAARHRGRTAARAVAVLLGFNPFFVYYGGLVLTEIPIIICTSLLLWLLDRWRNEPRIMWGVLCGLFSGLAHLIKPFMLALLGVVVLYFLAISIRSVKRRIFVAPVLVAVAVCLLVIAPWGIRNHLVFGRPMLSSSMGGLVIYAGNNPLNRSGGGINHVDYREPDEALAMLAARPVLAAARRAGKISDEAFFGEMARLELARNRLLFERALDWITENPGRFARLAVIKAVRLWNPVPYAPEFRKPHLLAISALYMVPVLLLAIVGLWGSRLHPPGPIFFAAFMIMGVTLLHMVLIGSIRYREPVMPYVCLFAAFGLNDLARRFGRSVTA